jgi:hypothetical protein
VKGENIAYSGRGKIKFVRWGERGDIVVVRPLHTVLTNYIN